MNYKNFNFLTFEVSEISFIPINILKVVGDCYRKNQRSLLVSGNSIYKTIHMAEAS